MDTATRNRVRQRAESRCEYCRLSESATPFIPFHAEHIIARQHFADDSLDNLALACDRCNAYKGPNLSSIDPVSISIVALFHPRQDNWDEHFKNLRGMVLVKTPKGRATVKLLNMNAPRRVQSRASQSESS